MSGTLPVAGATNAEWTSTACILCECNCGIEVTGKTVATW
jgi:hypothetical protein